MVRWPRHLTASLDDASRREVARLVQAERSARPTLQRAGTVLEFRRGGQLLCGYLARDPTNRKGYDVIGVDGRRRHLRRDKVVYVSAEYVSMHTPEMALTEIRSIDRRREAARRAVDLDALWQVAVEAAPDRGDWSLEELVDLHDPGDPDASRRAGMLRALWHGHRFERHGAGWRPRSPEAVEEIEAASAREEAQTSRQAALASWLRGAADGHASDIRPAGAEEALALLESAALGEGSPAAAALTKAANLHGAAAAFDVLVRLGHWSADENLELHRLGLPVKFSEAAAKAARDLDPAAVPAGWPRRRRLGAGLCATACGERAYRLRRGLTGRAIVDIHMAVPVLWLEAGGVLDQEAAARGLTVRLLERDLLMLPEELTRACRLTPDEARPVLTLSVRLDRDLTPGRVRLSMGRARPRLSLEDGESRAERRLARLAQELRQRRRRAGAWEALHPAGEIEVRGGRPLPAAEGPADLIDTELRLLAAEAIARLCDGRAPAVYAVREGPAGGLPETALQGAGDTAAAETLRAHLLESDALRERLDTSPAPHAGLGLPACAAGARPLTSCVDLAMQRQLLSMAGWRSGPLEAADLERILLETREARESARRVRRSSRRYWTLKWLEGLGGEARLECVVAEARGPGHLVLLPQGSTAAWVPAPRGRRLQAAPGQRLRVRVEQASARRDLLRLAGPELARGADRDPPA